ncbi:TIGR03087 family PEP-CTERM/XrtA system glycosyltransferase [Aliiglaciecola sp. CAU 1673]|uniref:TIGR03087 family PEP-CTERM/XrtA system glycosyltransferase n=1 Tax=Aliiglaciecola sp. CAU 1673 TaxID=3032595 RepID=UPI0023D9845E|nr:TIGR03087 family PEP-CTERM/XrtA system glycosyltransferase [Aliiglaciecola sp. CAU 1673]MDF2177285.1 TIGR03087 family PEP-CTERM/XrtA system glycosyltransferase [Aliiglaciecola sp. CAU 1673]
MKEPLLYLCHRIPFPPNKGDKIRSFNILKELSKSFDIYLAAFVDDPHDWQYKDDLTPFCKEVLLLPLHPLRAKLKGLTAFLCNKPISLPYFHSRELQRWVNQQIEQQQIRKCFVYSSAMAQYLEHKVGLKRVADFVDVDSDKWRQYADNAGNPLLKFVYGREARTLGAYEKKITASFDAITFVSDQEAAFFRKDLPLDSAAKVSSFPNGVDTGFFDASLPHANPIDKPYLVFTGAMDYWANVDAVCWFVEKVWPLLLSRHPDLHFAIVGGNPTDKVKALAKHKQVLVTGRVPDIRPYIQHSVFAIASLRIARGIQNKVLEAMAMGKAVVMTSMAAEGIELPPQQKPYVVDKVDEFASVCASLLSDTDSMSALGQMNFHWIASHYRWDAVTAELINLME